jgi:hypothetical protein
VVSKRTMLQLAITLVVSHLTVKAIEYLQDRRSETV